MPALQQAGLGCPENSHGFYSVLAAAFPTQAQEKEHDAQREHLASASLRLKAGCKLFLHH